MQMEIDAEWIDCRPTLSVLRGVVSDPQWKRIDPGDETIVGISSFWCRDESLRMKNLDWSELPGEYRFKVTVTHRMLESHELEQSGPAPDGANAWTLASNAIDLSVEEPSGVDAEALEWAREHGYRPVSVKVASKFPTSRYGALVVWQALTLHDGTPEQIVDSINKGFYPGRYTVPDASSANGQRTVNAGKDMARWRVEHGERLLRDQPDFPHAREVRLSVAVSYAVLGGKEEATELLTALKNETGTPQGRWAERFLALQGW
jgi:hypothetical protein